jgi:hypothetical protein
MCSALAGELSISTPWIRIIFSLLSVVGVLLNLAEALHAVGFFSADPVESGDYLDGEISTFPLPAPGPVKRKPDGSTVRRSNVDIDELDSKRGMGRMRILRTVPFASAPV